MTQDTLEIALTLTALLCVGRLVVVVGMRVGAPSALTLIALGAGLGTTGLIPASYLEASPVLSAMTFAFLLVRAGVSVPAGVFGRARRRRLFQWALTLIPVAAEWGLVYGLARVALDAEPLQAALLAAIVSAVSPALMLPHLIARAEAADGGNRDRDRVTVALGLQVVLNAVIAQTLVLALLASAGADVGAPRALVFFLSWPSAWLLGRSIRPLRPGSRAGAATLLVAGGIALYFGARHLGAESVLATLIFAAAAVAPGADRARLKGWLVRGWRGAEVPLFLNLGLAIDFGALGNHGAEGLLMPAFVVIAGVAGRIAVAEFVLVRGQSAEDRVQIRWGQVPKATVQAVFGLLAGRALAGIPGKEAWSGVILGTAVLAIVLTAPIGAIALERAGRAESPRPGA